MGVVTAKMTSKGQVVIPEKIRKKMGLAGGSEFVVMESYGSIILKAVTEPAVDDLQELLTRLRGQARRVGLKKPDIRSAIRRVRGKAR